MSPQIEATVRRAGALLALAAASALVLVLFAAAAAVDGRPAVLILTLFAALLLGCAAVLLSPAHHGVALLQRCAAKAARDLETLAMLRRAATERPWAGFTAVVLCAVYVIGDSRQEPAAAAKEEVSVRVVTGFLLLLVLLAGVWALHLSMVTGRGSRPAAGEQLDGGEVKAMLPTAARRVSDPKF